MKSQEITTIINYLDTLKGDLIKKLQKKECKCKKCGCDKNKSEEWIFERNSDTNVVWKRRKGDYTTPRQEVIFESELEQGVVSEEEYNPSPHYYDKIRNMSPEAGKEFLIKEYMSIKGGEFNTWWSNLPEEHKLIITKEFNF